jgi:quinol monooxygenase YgiN
MTSRIKVVAVFHARVGHEKDLEALLRGMAGPSRNEPGNLHYNLWRNAERPEEFVLEEMYVDADANAAHRASAHFQNYLAHVNEYSDRTVMVLDAVDVRGA